MTQEGGLILHCDMWCDMAGTTYDHVVKLLPELAIQL